MPHASLCVPLRSVRDARLIHMSTTASGWRKHSRSSTSFFITLPYPGRQPGIAPGAERPGTSIICVVLRYFGSGPEDAAANHRAAASRETRMLTYVLAVLAACANATSSVLQRKANRRPPRRENMSLRLIWSLAHEPVWFGGILAVTAGFLPQAAALGG